VGLAAGFHPGGGGPHLQHRALQAILRPAILTAFLGYLLVVTALLFDLGRPTACGIR